MRSLSPEILRRAQESAAAAPPLTADQRAKIRAILADSRPVAQATRQAGAAADAA